jgi:hypothetical protein
MSQPMRNKLVKTITGTHFSLAETWDVPRQFNTFFKWRIHFLMDFFVINI